MTDRVASLALAAWLGSCAGCTALLDLDGYSVAADAGASEINGLLPDAGAAGQAVAVFDHYRFERGQASFDVAASEGLLANDAASAVAAGSFATTAGGGIELAADGSFRYTPPGSPGAFWGDDTVEYGVVGSLGRARARLTVVARSFDLGELGASGAGFGIAGGDAFDGIATYYQALDSAGDVNGDGFEDIVIGVPGPAVDVGGGLLLSSGRGARVVFGKADTAPVSLADLGGEPPKGFAVLGNGDELDYDSMGSSVAGVGDVNGDGFDDVIVSQIGFEGETDSDPDFVDPLGMGYVVFGKRDAEPVDPAAIRAGLGGGFALVGPPEYRFVGYGVSAAGDVNGDGLADVMVSVPPLPAEDGSPPLANIAYVVFGQEGTEPVQLGTLGQDGRGFEINGEPEGWSVGSVLSGVGDINGDGLDDVAVNAPDLAGATYLRGSLAVVFGKRDTNPVPIAAVAEDPTIGFTIYNADDGDTYLDARSAGDVNGDGFDDLLIGAPLASFGPPVLLVTDAGAGDAGTSLSDAGLVGSFPEQGVTYVVYGSPNPATMSLRDIEQPAAAGFAVGELTPGARLGTTSGSGDINGDGFSDVLIGTEPSLIEGKAYAVLGAESTSTLTLPTPDDAVRVLEITGATSDGLGRIVTSGADVNADGLDDLIVGAVYYSDAPQNAGGVYVAFGWDISDALGERDRALIGGASDDVFELPISPIVIARGGNGIDTLRVGARQEPLDLRERGRYESLEVIDARGGGPQVIELDDAALRRIPGNLPGFAFSLARRLTIIGDSDDTLRFDMAGYASRGPNAGRTVYARPGVYYGLEVSRELRIAAP